MTTETADKLSPLQQNLLDRADSIFAAIGNTVTKATDFATAEIPDIAYQYVAYGRVMATVILIMCAIFLCSPHML